MDNNSKKQLLTKETIEKQLKKETVKNPYSNSGCLFTFGGAIIGLGCILLFWMVSSDRSKLAAILCDFAVILLGCWPIWKAIKIYRYAKNNKNLFESNSYRIVKSNCVKIKKEHISEETGPDHYWYSCDLENGGYASFILNEIEQQESGDPVDIGTPVFTVYLGEIPKLYYSGKQYVLSSELVVEE